MTRPPLPRHAPVWGWAALLCYFPLILLLAPPGGTLAGLAARVALFHGAGALACTALLLRGGMWPRVAPLLRRPLAGVVVGLAAFALAALLVTVLLHVAGVHAPGWLRGLLRPFDLGLPAMVAAGPVLERWLRAGLIAAGSVAEEWIFRVALWWGWTTRHARTGSPREALLPLAGLGAVSLYFALLHAPQGVPAVVQALLGSVALGLLLWWRRSFALVATLHALFNWPGV